MKSKSSPKIDTKFVQKWASMLENTLDEHGILVKVVEVNNLGHEIRYHLRVVAGLKLKHIIELAPDIVLAMSSPTGKVKIEAPIPGTNQVGVTVPVPKDIKDNKKQSYKVVNITKTVSVPNRSIEATVGNMLVSFFEFIGKHSYKIAERLSLMGVNRDK